MKINILHYKEGALKARGLTVVIDVFRAFSTACYIFEQGAETIIPVLNVEQAFTLKKENPNYVLVGERGGEMIKGFNYGNSPTAITNTNLKSKKVVLTTSSGTLGLYNSINAKEIITGSFVNAKAIANYIRLSNAKEVSLVAMGNAGKTRADEDVFLAEYLKALLLDKEYDFNSAKEKLRNSSGQRFFDSTIHHSPKTDFDLCLKLNRFNFVLKFINDSNYGYLIKVE